MKSFLIAAVLIRVVAAWSGGIPTQARPDLAIRHVNVIDVTGGPTRQDQRMLITGDRITSISPDDSSLLDAGRIVDAGGTFVIPGLWDMHQHVMQYPGVIAAEIPDISFPLYIANGVLGVRDMGSRDFASLARLREEVNTGKVLGPRLVITGRALDGVPPTDGNKRPVANAAEAAQAVRDLKAAGADFVKVYERLTSETFDAIANECRRQNLPFTGHLPLGVSVDRAIAAGQRSIEHMGQGRLCDRCYGYLPEGKLASKDTDPAATAALMTAINNAFDGQTAAGYWTRETFDWIQSGPGRGALESIRNSLGRVQALTVLRRQSLAGGTDVVVTARQDSGERSYRFMVDPNGLVDWRPGEPDVELPRQVRALADQLRVARIWIAPTLLPLRAVAYRREVIAAADARLDYVTVEVRNAIRPVSDSRLAAWTDVEWGFARRAFERDARLVTALRRAGVRMLAATDAITDYCLPGFGLHEELALLVGAGLTPLEALQAATIEPATFLDRERDLGSVETGKFADLVLLSADPLADIHNTTKVHAVVRAGRLLDRAELDRQLAQVRARVNTGRNR